MRARMLHGIPVQTQIGSKCTTPSSAFPVQIAQIGSKCTAPAAPVPVQIAQIGSCSQVYPPLNLFTPRSERNP